MSDERRYQEEEVEEILDLAVRPDAGSSSGVSREGGLTLGELQDVGREAGIAPERIAAAALALDSQREVLPRRNFLGMPISVGRIVELPRPLTDREWDVLVADLRDTFAATGRVGSQGGAREWSNGNLRVLLEPTESGHRLRLSTLNGRLRFLSSLGVVELVAAIVLLAILVPELLSTSGPTLEAIITLVPSLILAGAGVGALAWTRFNLPRWAHERESQMEQIGVRARVLAEQPPGEEASS